MATAAEIAADLVELRAARMALAKGERIKDVWRDGRRLVFSDTTIEQLNSLISVYENDLAAATAAEAGSPRRRAIQLGWRN